MRLTNNIVDTFNGPVPNAAVFALACEQICLEQIIVLANTAAPKNKKSPKEL